VTDLDERARRATDALLSQLEQSAPSAWQEPRPSHRGARWAAAFAVAAALVVGVVVFARHTGGHETRLATGGAVSSLPECDSATATPPSTADSTTATSSTSCDSSSTASTSAVNSSSQGSPSNHVPTDAFATKAGVIGGYSYVAFLQLDGSGGILLTPPDGPPRIRGGWVAAWAALDSPFPGMIVFKNQRFGVVYGRAPNAATRVRVTLDSGDSFEGPVEPIAGQPCGIYAFGVEFQHPEPAPNATALYLTPDGAKVAQQLFPYADYGK
jgi:hypothetical protein